MAIPGDDQPFAQQRWERWAAKTFSRRRRRKVNAASNDEGPTPATAKRGLCCAAMMGRTAKVYPQERAADIPHLSVTENNSQNLVQSHLESRLRLALAADALVMREIGKVGVMRNVIPTYL